LQETLVFQTPPILLSTWLIDSTDIPAAAAADPADSTDVPV